LYELNQKIQLKKINKKIILISLNKEGEEEIKILQTLLNLSIEKLFKNNSSSKEFDKIFKKIQQSKIKNNILIYNEEDLLQFKGVLDSFFISLKEHSNLPTQIEENLNILRNTLKNILI
jgi:hypothetical protein